MNKEHVDLKSLDNFNREVMITLVPTAGCNIFNCLVESARVCLDYRVDVTFNFNSINYYISYKDLTNYLSKLAN